MPSPNPKRRRLFDDSEVSPQSSVHDVPSSTKDDWQRLLQGQFTPTETKTDMPNFSSSPMTPAETPMETPLETKTNNGFAMPTPRLPSTLRTANSTANSTLSTANSTLPSTNSIASTIPGTSASLLSTVSNLSAIGSTKHLTPFTPTGDHIKDVDSVPLNFRKLLITAFKVYEEETLIRLDDKKVKTHMNTMLDGMKQKAAARGDKLIIKLKELLDYIPKTYHDWTRSTMQVC